MNIKLNREELITASEAARYLTNMRTEYLNSISRPEARDGSGKPFPKLYIAQQRAKRDAVADVYKKLQSKLTIG